MKRILMGFSWLACLFMVSAALAGGNPLSTASGKVVKAEADSLTIQPRGPDGKFGKSLLLKVTGTSKVTVVSQQKRAGKLVFVQKEIEAKDLSAHQPIAAIYSVGAKGGAVLLSAVALPEASK